MRASYCRWKGKAPGQALRLRPIDLDYRSTHDLRAAESPSAYEHLLLDALSSDPTFFARADEVQAAWAAVEPVLTGWAAEGSRDLQDYEAGSPGPAAADERLARAGRRGPALARARVLTTRRPLHP